MSFHKPRYHCMCHEGFVQEPETHVRRFSLRTYYAISNWILRKTRINVPVEPVVRKSEVVRHIGMLRDYLSLREPGVIGADAWWKDQRMDMKRLLNRQPIYLVIPGFSMLIWPR
eukprot:Protomagalhaensia_wolfi_Nauph_80__637@NODE_1361_length_1565_cov_39_544561_g1053_i0_p3_GENE_NODE_1361_length_1565_cov_39_544561_g1053_i0NODE_1361_length_1565_cov_39_544561_g1053_i0_p3_ORF_typecomplete_len114_score2_69cEGF/PF12662_7/0_22_NODE_1361_length_1565_cov_39_544561_g1053_i09141255